MFRVDHGATIVLNSRCRHSQTNNVESLFLCFPSMVSLHCLVALALTTPAWGAILDLIVIEGKHSGCPENFNKVQRSHDLDGDLNEGAGGAYIWLCVREGLSDEPITSLNVVAEGGSDGGCGSLGSDWHRMRQEQGSNGDLNHGAG